MSVMQCLECVKKGLNAVCNTMYTDPVSMNLLKAAPWEGNSCAGSLFDHNANLIQHVQKECFRSSDCKSVAFVPNYCFQRMADGQIWARVTNEATGSFVGGNCGTMPPEKPKFTMEHVAAFAVASIVLYVALRYVLATPAKKPETLKSSLQEGAKNHRELLTQHRQVRNDLLPHLFKQPGQKE